MLDITRPITTNNPINFIDSYYKSSVTYYLSYLIEIKIGPDVLFMKYCIGFIINASITKYKTDKHVMLFYVPYVNVKF